MALLNERNFIMNMLGATTSTTDISKEKLMEDLRIVVADAEELLKATANQTGERIAAARARVGESLQAAKTRLSNAQVAVMEKSMAGDRNCGSGWYTFRGSYFASLNIFVNRRHSFKVDKSG
jgi:ElaB/YqjD/DUF883 family membrane-anchored ribosome-binding protein